MWSFCDIIVYVIGGSFLVIGLVGTKCASDEREKRFSSIEDDISNLKKELLQLKTEMAEPKN